MYVPGNPTHHMAKTQLAFFPRNWTCITGGYLSLSEPKQDIFRDNVIVWGWDLCVYFMTYDQPYWINALRAMIVVGVEWHQWTCTLHVEWCCGCRLLTLASTLSWCGRHLFYSHHISSLLELHVWLVPTRHLAQRFKPSWFMWIWPTPSWTKHNDTAREPWAMWPVVRSYIYNAEC